MWQLDSAATSASSGSTASAREKGTFTDNGEEEAETFTPPSNDHSCARLNLPSAKASPLARFQETAALYSCAMVEPPFYDVACFAKASYWARSISWSSSAASAILILKN